MGEAKRTEEASKDSFTFVVGWVQRALVILGLRKLEGKGAEFKRTLRDILSAFKLEDSWEYLEDTRNVFKSPDHEDYFVDSPEVAEGFRKSGITDRIRQIIVRTDTKVECPAREITLSRGQIEFILKRLQEEASDVGRVIEVLSPLFSDLEAALAGRYEAPTKPKLELVEETTIPR